MHVHTQTTPYVYVRLAAKWRQLLFAGEEPTTYHRDVRLDNNNRLVSVNTMFGGKIKCFNQEITIQGYVTKFSWSQLWSLQLDAGALVLLKMKVCEYVLYLTLQRAFLM